MNTVQNDAKPVMSLAEGRLVRWLFVLVAAALLIVQEGAITGYDGQTMYEVTRSLVERGTFAVSEEFNTLPGPDGRALLQVRPRPITRRGDSVRCCAAHRVCLLSSR